MPLGLKKNWKASDINVTSQESARHSLSKEIAGATAYRHKAMKNVRGKPL